jgi:hypothetical protein
MLQAMSKSSSRRIGCKRRARALAAFAAAAVSSSILSGVGPLVVVGALENTEKLNRENVHTSEVLQSNDYETYRFDTAKLRSKNQYLPLKGKSGPPIPRKRDLRQLVTDKEKKIKRATRTKVKMKTSSSSVQHQPSAAYTMVTKTGGQTTTMRVKNPLKEQMIRARLEKRTAKKRKRIGQGEQDNYTTEARKFLGNLELKWHQQVGVGSSSKLNWDDRQSGKPSGGWNNNRWSGGQRSGGSESGARRPVGSGPGGNPRGWKTGGWESGGRNSDGRNPSAWWSISRKPSAAWSGGEQPIDWWSDRESPRDWWSGGRDRGSDNNRADHCPCTYVDPVEVVPSWSWSGSSWSWSGSSWGEKMKVCTCKPTYKPTFYPTYLYPTYYPT